MIFTIFKKELLETLRDRRTLIVMIVIPVLLFPLIFKITSHFTNNLEEEAATKTLTVGYTDGAESLVVALKTRKGDRGTYKWKKIKDTLHIQQAIKDDSIQLGIYTDTQFGSKIGQNRSAKVKLFFDATDIGYKERLEKKIQSYNQELTMKRLDSMKIDKQLFSAIEIEDANVASTQEMIGKMAGGILPYIFIIFGFLGSMYPAIDLFTGEKERGTIETLLTTPVARWKILIGKMGVVVLSGLMAAAFALFGLYYSIQDLPAGKDMQGVSMVMNSLFNVKSLTTMFLLILPLIVFFAGLLVPITVYAKSFKEAQSIVSPLNIIIILPAMIGMFPGVEYSFGTAFIPVLNVVLATKEILAGTIDYVLYSCTFVSLLAIALLSVWVSHKQFGKETNISSL